MSPTTRLPYDARLRRAHTTATLRYHRRKAATKFFWFWAQERWGKQPNPNTKLGWRTVRDLPALRTIRPRKDSVGWHNNICYDDMLHLEEQAYMLCTRLAHARVRARAANDRVAP